MVYFTDGSSEEIDLIVAATGYKRSFPFLPSEMIKTSTDKEIDLHLEIFSKQNDNLFFAGGIEVSSATFGLFGLQGEAIASTIKAKDQNQESFRKFRKSKENGASRVQNKTRYVNSLRHKRYVDKAFYVKQLTQHIKSLAR
jgi:lysine/ornithine N-monooxygenase